VYIEGTRKHILNLKVNNINETLLIGEIIGKTLSKGSIVALNGNLGAGKTVLVKGIARGLGVEQEPNSPTFVILNTYEGKYPLFHFDFYRLSSASELEDLNYKDYFYNEGITVVEWAEKIKEVFPQNCITIDIEVPDNIENNGPVELRDIRIEGEEKWLLLFKNTAEQALQT
jgi:tRNA threonylcarbamoyladenosine biosynthesis protein TsaE